MKKTAVLFSVFIITVIVVADMGIMPASISALYDFPNGDKLGHFILFGFLNFFITRAFLSSVHSKSRSGVTLSVSLILSLLIALEEFSQKFSANRTFDLIDLFASFLGVMLGGWMAMKIKKS